MSNEEVSLERLVRAYRKVREAIQKLTREYEEELEGLETVRQQFTNEIKDRMLATGAKTIRTDSGTITLATKTRYTANDWDEFKKFVLEHQAVELLERRIAQSNMKQFLEENPTLVPPGLDASTEYAVTVRKPSK
jgi:hypothetical protein